VSRSARLLQLIEALRGRRRPVTAAILAAELGVTVRTIYRDVATLASEGVPIEGEAGIGYVLRPGFLMPPLMLPEEELEALVLGLRLVGARGDAPLARAGRQALSRILAVLPPDLRDRAEGAGLMAGPSPAEAEPAIDLAVVRAALRQERKLAIVYADGSGRSSQRVIWPIALAFFEKVRLVVAWCELRQDFRSFRADRITALTQTGEPYPRRRRTLMHEWRRREQIAEPG
jgi:predicted DNA-binding transcriptional regulator YafY